MLSVFVILSFVLSIMIYDVEVIQIGIIRNASLVLTSNRSSSTIEGNQCNNCLCKILNIDGFSSIVSFNCYIINMSKVSCDLFTRTNYQMSSDYRMDVNLNSTFYFVELPSITIQHASVVITRSDDYIMGLYNTRAGGSTGGKNGSYSALDEYPARAIDNSTETKYLNFGAKLLTLTSGTDTGFYVTPSISNASRVVTLRFATGNDLEQRDPLAVTLEGTNSTSLDIGSSWTLIYNGSTGLESNPGRKRYGVQQNFTNTIRYASYRLLVTSKRGIASAVQYSEVQIIGFV